MALDPGVSVLAALTSNEPGFVPRLVSGTSVKAVNQLYNKQREHAQKTACQRKSTPILFTPVRSDHDEAQPRRVTALPAHRQPWIVELLVAAKESEALVLGKNPFWKQAVELGKKHNQEFVHIPHAIFLEKVFTYKAEAIGIRVMVTEESYTSQASFLDLDVPAMIPPREQMSKTNRSSLGVAMVAGIASKGVPPSMPM